MLTTAAPPPRRILHDVGGTGLLFFTPLILYQLTGEGSPGEASGGGAGGHAALGGGATPARVAALSTVPYLITSVLHREWRTARWRECPCTYVLATRTPV